MAAANAAACHTRQHQLARTAYSSPVAGCKHHVWCNRPRQSAIARTSYSSSSGQTNAAPLGRGDGLEMFTIRDASQLLRQPDLMMGIAELLGSSFAADEGRSLPWLFGVQLLLAQMVALLFYPESAVFLLVKDQSQVVGCASVQLKVTGQELAAATGCQPQAPVVIFANVCVRETHRGKGVGRMIVQAAKRAASQEFCQPLGVLRSMALAGDEFAEMLMASSEAQGFSSSPDISLSSVSGSSATSVASSSSLSSSSPTSNSSATCNSSRISISSNGAPTISSSVTSTSGKDMHSLSSSSSGSDHLHTLDASQGQSSSSSLPLSTHVVPASTASGQGSFQPEPPSTQATSLRSHSHNIASHSIFESSTSSDQGQLQGSSSTQQPGVTSSSGGQQSVLSASSGQQSVPPTSSAQLATSSAQAATSAPSTGPTSGTTTSGTTSGTTSTPRRRFPVWWQSALPVFFALLVYKDNVAARRLYESEGWAEVPGWKDAAWEAEATKGKPGSRPRRLLYVRPVPGATPPEVLQRLGEGRNTVTVTGVPAAAGLGSSGASMPHASTADPSATATAVKEVASAISR